jgi:uncharacterized iron-regulated membrane protein
MSTVSTNTIKETKSQSSLWRIHFYTGMIVGPVMVWLAISGLGILYAQPLQRVLHSSENVVQSGTSSTSLESQVRNALTQFPKDTFSYITPGARSSDATQVGLSEPNGDTRIVWTNPYNGNVTGSMIAGKDLVGFFNSYHGSLLPRSWTMPVPDPAWFFGGKSFWRSIEIGEVLLEIFAGWGLMLAYVGLTQWWRSGSARRFLPRSSRKGRRRWRDLHTFGGVFVVGFLSFSLISGLPWASFWGYNWQTVIAHITPNKADFWSDPSPNSKSPRLGDMTRFGTRVAWAMQNDQPAPSSSPGMSMPGMNMGGEANVSSLEWLPAKTVSLDQVQSAMLQSGMAPNATIYPPANSRVDGKTSLGSYVVINPWPSSLGQQGASYFDEFTGRFLGSSTAKSWGLLQRWTEFGVQTHMGTEFGVATRIFMTLGCVFTIWMYLTALMMWNRRRRGTVGLPRRPAQPRLPRGYKAALVCLAAFYPLWGASVLVVYAVDRFVIQKNVRLSKAFGGTTTGSIKDSLNRNL